jgi:hypothetical protein
MTAAAAGAVSADQVREAAHLVSLPLTPQECGDIAGLLSQWIPAAVALSTRMQAKELDSVTPITAFASPDVAPGGENS